MTTISRREVDARPGPRYLAIADAIADAVAAGRLAAGARLPPQRVLAHQIGLSLNTVMRAYVEAERRGLVTGEVGRGTYVRARVLPGLVPQALRSDPAAGSVDLRTNTSLQDEAAALLPGTLIDLGGTDDAVAALLAPVEATADGLAMQAAPRHAGAGCRWIGRLGMAVQPATVHLTMGAQHGILVALMALCRPGDVVLVEAWTYPLIRQLAERLAFQLQPVAMDADGIIPDSLDEACRRTRARILYCMPTMHCATTATMPEDRRRRIAALAVAHGLTVIEDEVFGHLPPARPPPLAALAPEHCVLVTSVSKSVAAWLRLGFLQAPARLAEPIRSAIHMTAWRVSPVLAEIGTTWILDGSAERLNAGRRADARARQAVARHALGLGGAGNGGAESEGPGNGGAGDGSPGDGGGGATWHAAEDAFHLWLELAPPWRADAFCLEAARRGVEILPGEVFAVPPAAGETVRVCLGMVRSPERLQSALATLAAILCERPHAARPVI